MEKWLERFENEKVERWIISVFVFAFFVCFGIFVYCWFRFTELHVGIIKYENEITEIINGGGVPPTNLLYELDVCKSLKPLFLSRTIIFGGINIMFMFVSILYLLWKIYRLKLNKRKNES